VQGPLFKMSLRFKLFIIANAGLGAKGYRNTFFELKLLVICIRVLILPSIRLAIPSRDICYPQHAKTLSTLTEKDSIEYIKGSWSSSRPEILYPSFSYPKISLKVLAELATAVNRVKAPIRRAISCPLSVICVPGNVILFILIVISTWTIAIAHKTEDRVPYT
jgi:hypothetical protein